MPNWLTTPLVPKSAIQGTQDKLEQPKLDQSPFMAGLKGFGSGALEGLRGQTSPLNLAGIAAMMIPGAGLVGRGAKAASEVPEALSGLANITPDLVEAAPAVKQVMPTAQDALDLGGLLRHNLAKVPNAASKAVEGPLKGLGAASAEFTPVGREAAYNAGRMAQAPEEGAGILDYLRSLSPVQKTLKGY
jgi:hypothetical protein